MIRAASFLRPTGGISSTMMMASSSSSQGASKIMPGNNILRCIVSRKASLSSSNINVNTQIMRSLAAAPSLLCKHHQQYGSLFIARYNPTSNRLNTRLTALRSLSSSSSSSNNKDSKSQSSGADGGGEGEPTSQEIVLTPGEKVVAGTRLFFWAGAFAFASVCAYYIGKELLPTKMSPNTIFDKATNVLRQNDEVKKRFGENFKTYGRDHGGHREGRRNFIEHTEYTSEDDGSKRTRVRFNLEGPYGTAFVFAEVSKDMASGEFVYILVQDKRGGMVITVEDNRSALLAKRLAGGSQEGQDVFSNLLGGGKK